MPEKYGVDTNSEATKVAADKAEPSCPFCGAKVERDVNVRKCPRCGTLPFEPPKP